MAITVFDPFNDMCPFCLGELRRGGPEDGKCGHEKLLADFPHLRFNADSHLDAAALQASRQRYAASVNR